MAHPVAQDRAGTADAAEPVPVSGIATIPCAESYNAAINDAWRAAYEAEPLAEFPCTSADYQAFIYGKHCAVAAIRALTHKGTSI